jgi:flagellar protein FliS
MSYGAKSYKKTAVETASREQILLMLYETAIKSCKLAKKAMEEKNVADKCKHIGKVHDIVMELNNTLDHGKGQQIAGQLESLYNFCVSQLLVANMNNDLKAMENVTKVLITLYEGWVAAVKEMKKNPEEAGR